jgi:hypothetical protein
MAPQQTLYSFPERQGHSVTLFLFLLDGVPTIFAALKLAVTPPYRTVSVNPITLTPFLPPPGTGTPGFPNLGTLDPDYLMSAGIFFIPHYFQRIMKYRRWPDTRGHTNCIPRTLNAK